ncbi:MAG: stage III sporulation protein AA [Clostridia bacterium]|jgi:stage III sporulation protein AA|nr:stage III sporulation protein AA [Clostridium sp. CAG:571]
MLDILKFFPRGIANEINKEISKIEELVQEIRIRVGNKIIIKTNKKDDIIINYFVTQEEILEIMQIICNNSIYSYQNEIANGYITIKGGHRVGVTGDVVLENNKVINIKYISSLNFRIAKQILDCSNNILKYVINLEENTVFHTLIVSPPGAGKTTILKDLVRKISDGIPEIGFKGIDVSLIDERGEISAMYNGVPQNKIGIRTDVLENVSKPIGIKMAVRSMAPKVIVADEIGNYNDIEAINYAVCSGVKGIFTAHSLSYETMMLNKELNKLINMKIIERIIFLDSKTKGKIKNVYLLAEDTKNYLREVVKN